MSVRSNSRLKFCHGFDNVFVAMASADGTVSIGDVCNSSQDVLVSTDHVPATSVTDLDLTLTDEFLVTAYMDGSVCLWDVKRRRQLRYHCYMFSLQVVEGKGRSLSPLGK